MTEEDEEEVVAEGERVRVSSLFVFSLKTPAFFAFVKSERRLWCQSGGGGGAKDIFQFHPRERERERENVGGGGEENDINEH